MSSEEITLRVIDVLNAVQAPYMLVGSLSSNYYGVPRSTRDMDIVVEQGMTSVREIAHQLGPEFILDPQPTFEMVTATIRHEIKATSSSFRIEFFQLSDDPYDQERFRRRRRVLSLSREIYLPTAEDVILVKLRWALLAQRAKDREDVLNVLSVQRDSLDWDYIHRWCDIHGTRALLDEVRGMLPSL